MLKIKCLGKTHWRLLEAIMSTVEMKIQVIVFYLLLLGFPFHDQTRKKVFFYSLLTLSCEEL
jgi:hypothetical protein